MPTREELYPATATMLMSTQSPYYTSIGKTFGKWKSISALNNVGKFVPGVLRMNPVIIQEFTGIPGASTSMSGTDKAGAYYLSIHGNLAPFVASATNLHVPNTSSWNSYSAWDATAAGHSLQKALASMNEADLDVGVMLGELNETISGLANPFQAIRKYATLHNKLMKSGKRPKPSDTLDMLSGSWLEWRYGIMPLIYSIQDIIEHVQRKSIAMQGKILRRTGKVTRSYKAPSVRSSTSPYYYTIAGETKINVKQTYTTKIYFTINRPMTWRESFGLTEKDLPAIIWEITKLSFVWDWFFSVGDWLQSLEVSSLRTSLGSCTSCKSVVVAETKTDSIKIGTTVSKASHSSCTHQLKKLERRVNLTPPLGPVVNKQNLSLKRQIDALALMWQMLPRLRR